jgi:hypothetical protein|tara:strand:- start:911 stop:1390 length:480 start_codon:yes stop_codon:yes gene_type:complete
MWMQTVNRADTERVWVNFTNRSGETLSARYPVFKFLTAANSASVSVNDGAKASSALVTGAEAGPFLGMAYEDVADNDVGVAQVYGYFESALIWRIVGSVTVRAGGPLGPGAAASVGFNSNGATSGMMGPLIAMDTVTATLISLGTPASNWADHVFIRAM